jgi:uncharacterized protein (DUF983 family)
MRCPNCGARTLFKGLLSARDRCPNCDLKFEREDGFFLGALVINYTITGVLVLAPLLVLVFMGRVDVFAALVFAVVASVVVPLILYRPSKSLWLMTYYYFFPHHLPANGWTQGDDRGQQRD